VVYGEPPEYEYVVPVDRGVVVTRDVLVSRGYVVYRVEPDGPNRVTWARRGDEDVVRVLARSTSACADTSPTQRQGIS
jgi:hypothetical protein